MHQQQRLSGRVPALVVQDNGENGDLVTLADPVYAAGDGEEIGSVANDLADKFLLPRTICGEFDSESLGKWSAK